MINNSSKKFQFIFQLKTHCRSRSRRLRESYFTL